MGIRGVAGLFVGLFAFGCQTPPAAAPVVAQAPVPVRREPKGLVLHWAYDRIPIELRDEYGAILINDGDEQHPRARFVFGCRKDRRLVSTYDLPTFIKALKRIPRGSIVHRHDSCQVSRSNGLPESAYARFEAAFKQAGLKLTEENRIECVCEAFA